MDTVQQLRFPPVMCTCPPDLEKSLRHYADSNTPGPHLQQRAIRSPKARYGNAL